VFVNRVLRRIFGLKRDEVIGGWRKLRNEELHSLYSSPSIIRIIKTRNVRLAGNVAGMGKMNAYRILVGQPGGQRLHVGRSTILKESKTEWEIWTGLICHRIGTSGAFLWIQ
jgi:hypothetical protein